MLFFLSRTLQRWMRENGHSDPGGRSCAVAGKASDGGNAQHFGARAEQLVCDVAQLSGIVRERVRGVARGHVVLARRARPPSVLGTEGSQPIGKRT